MSRAMLECAGDLSYVVVLYLQPTAFSLLIFSFILYIFGKQIFDSKIEISRLKSIDILGQLQMHNTASKIIQLAMGLLKRIDLSMTAEFSDYRTADLAAQIHADKQQLVEICRTAYGMHTKGLERSNEWDDELLSDRYRLASVNRTFEECISDLGCHTPMSQGNRVDEDLAVMKDSIYKSDLLNACNDELQSNSSDTECDVLSLSVEGQIIADDIWGISPDELHAGDAETTSRRSEDEFAMRKELEMTTPREVVQDIEERNRVAYETLCLDTPMHECATCTPETKLLTELFIKYEAERVKNLHLTSLLASADLYRGILESQIIEDAIKTERLVNDHDALLNRAADLEKEQTDIDKSVIFELYTERCILRAEINSLAHECVDLEGEVISRDIVMSHGTDSTHLPTTQCDTNVSLRALHHINHIHSDVRAAHEYEQEHGHGHGNGRSSSHLNSSTDADAGACTESQHGAAQLSKIESTLRQGMSPDVYSALNGGMLVFSDHIVDEEHRMTPEHINSISIKLEGYFPVIGNRDKGHTQDNHDHAMISPQVAELRQEIEILTARNVASETARKADLDTVFFLRQEIESLRHEMRYRGKGVPLRRVLPSLTPCRGMRLSCPVKVSWSPLRVSGGTSVEEGEGDGEQEWDEEEERGGEWSEAVGDQESECVNMDMDDDVDISDSPRSESDSEDEEEEDQEPFYSVRGVSSSSYSCFRTTPGKPITLS